MPIGADGLSGQVSQGGSGLRGGSPHSPETERPRGLPSQKKDPEDLSQKTPEELRAMLMVKVNHNVKEWGPGKITAWREDVLRELGRRELARRAQTEADVLSFSGSGGIQMQGSAPWSRGGRGVKVGEKSPPGWSGTVKAMKKHPEIDNPFALAWSMKKKGYKPHVKPEESILDILSDADLVLEGSIPTADLATKPPKGVDPEVWHDVVHRGKHTDYGGARAHYNRTIAKMKRATPGPAPEPSAAELSGGRYGTERYRELNQKPFVAPGWHRNVGESQMGRNEPTHGYRADSDHDIALQNAGYEFRGRKGSTFHYNHPDGHTAWTRPDGSWNVFKNGMNYNHDEHELSAVLDDRSSGPFGPAGDVNVAAPAGDYHRAQMRALRGRRFSSVDAEHLKAQRTGDWSRPRRPGGYKGVGEGFYPTHATHLKRAGYKLHSTDRRPGYSSEIWTKDAPGRESDLQNTIDVSSNGDWTHRQGATLKGNGKSFQLRRYLGIDESESYLTGSPTDKTRLTGQIQIRIREGTTIDVRSPDRILDNMNAYIFFEQWQQYLPKSPMLQANTMFRISEWWKLHAEQGDLLSIDLVNGATRVVNEASGKQYSLGCFGTQPDIFLDGMEVIEKL